MAKNSCELCGTVSPKNETLFGVCLCQECRWGYRNAMDGDIEAYKRFSDPKNFPDATPKAVNEILSIVASKKIVSSKTPPKPSPSADTAPKSPDSNAVSQQTNAVYQQPTTPYQQPTATYQQQIKTYLQSPHKYAATKSNAPSLQKSFFDGLYSRIGYKIKTWAKWIFIIEAIAAVIGGLVMIFTEEDVLIVTGIVTMITGPFVAFVSSWILYGFGELIEKTSDNEQHTREILKIMSENNK